MARSVEDFIVDFSKEEEGGGGGAHYKPDTYLVRIAGAKTGISENKNTPYLEVIFAFKQGRYAKRKAKLAERLYISPKAMRRFRILLQAVGLKVPAKFSAPKIIPKIKGKELYIEVEDKKSSEGYEDSPPRSQVAFEGFISVDDYDPDDEEEEDEDLEEEDEELEDEDDLEDEEDEDEEEEEPRPRSKSSRKGSSKSSASRRKRKPEPEEDEDEEDEDEDEDEEPPTRKRRSKTKAKPKRKASKSEDEDEDEDLDSLDLDDM